MQAFRSGAARRCVAARAQQDRSQVTLQQRGAALALAGVLSTAGVANVAQANEFDVRFPPVLSRRIVSKSSLSPGMRVFRVSASVLCSLSNTNRAWARASPRFAQPASQQRPASLHIFGNSCQEAAAGVVLTVATVVLCFHTDPIFRAWRGASLHRAAAVKPCRTPQRPAARSASQMRLVHRQLSFQEHSAQTQP